MKTQLHPSFEFERPLWNAGLNFVAGIDEVGRGAFAGPIVAAAVIFKPCLDVCRSEKLCLRCSDYEFRQINDSKLLTETKRKQLSNFIKNNALYFHISEIPVAYINTHGIGKANQKALLEAVTGLAVDTEYILIDGFKLTGFNNRNQKSIIKGDRKSLSIAAASIIAKVYRDELMQGLGLNDNKYFFKENKGYGTSVHRDALSRFGLSVHHRLSFNLAKYTSSPER